MIYPENTSSFSRQRLRRARGKKTPPYARSILGLSPSAAPSELGIYAGSLAWDRAAKSEAAGFPTLALPTPIPRSITGRSMAGTCFSWSRASFLWRQVDFAAYCLLRDGATIVRALMPDSDIVVYRRREVSDEG